MPFVYIMASARNGTIYIGVTKDLIRRVHQHKADAVESFTQRYGIHDLVWYEHTDSIISAIHREKQLKNWKREWKIRLIEASNPHWQDLYPSLLS
jgi:putative endonuclease